MVLPVEQRDREGRRLGSVEVRRQAWEGDGVELLGDNGIVGDDEPRCRAAQALVGAHRHEMGTVLERLRPGVAGDHAAEMRGIEQDQGANLVGDGSDLPQRMREEVEAAADRDELRPQRSRLRPQRRDVDRVAVGVNRGGVDLQAVAAGAARQVMGDVAADAGRRDDDPVAGLGRKHEGVEVRDRSRRHADLRVPRAEDLGRELGRDHLDLLDPLEPHLVLGARVAERWARAEAGGQGRLGPRVHHIGGRVEVDAVGLVDRLVQRDAAVDRGGDFLGVLRRSSCARASARTARNAQAPSRGARERSSEASWKRPGEVPWNLSVKKPRLGPAAQTSSFRFEAYEK